jgi:hypothetical protein
MKSITLVLTIGVLVAIVAVLIGSMARSIVRERRSRGLRGLWTHFGLSIAFCVLFLVSWAAQGVTEWSSFAQEQRVHGEPVEISDFVVAFGQSTFENWQSEFLQLFSFVVLAALLIHRGSAESKDGEDEILASVKRIESRLDHLERRLPS